MKTMRNTSNLSFQVKSLSDDVPLLNAGLVFVGFSSSRVCSICGSAVGVCL